VCLNFTNVNWQFGQQLGNTNLSTAFAGVENQLQDKPALLSAIKATHTGERAYRVMNIINVVIHRHHHHEILFGVGPMVFNLLKYTATPNNILIA
jgi:hypothetical protein